MSLEDPPVKREEAGERSLSSRSLLPREVSWQRFPRSTSSKSFCDDSSESRVLVVEEQSAQTSLTLTTASSTAYPRTKPRSQLKAEHYLRIRCAHEFFHFLMEHLVCNRPEDPLIYLERVLDQCLEFRDGHGDPPLLVGSHHVASLYKAFDPFGNGYISMKQYEEAMRTLGIDRGITPPKRDPELTAGNFVAENTFTTEANRCLMTNLIKMIRIPKRWEENRLVWKRRMEKVTLKKAALEAKTEVSKEDAPPSNDDTRCRCPYAVSRMPQGEEDDEAAQVCPCPKTIPRHEVHQLFLHV